MQTRDAILLLALSVGFFFFIDWLRTRKRRRKEKQAAAEFKTTYEKLVADHAELYEKISVPFDDNDRKAVTKYHLVVRMLLLPFAGGFFALLYFNWPSNWEDALAAFCFALIVVVGFGWSIHNKSKLLANNEKVIIKGVITYKKITEEDDSKVHYITISEKDSIMISSGDYKKYNLGDIIKLEVLGSLTSMLKYKIVLMGKLEKQSR